MVARRFVSPVFSAAVLAALALSSPGSAQLPRVVVDHDDVDVTASCTLVFGAEPVADRNGDGVVRIKAAGVVVTCEGVLRGATPGAAPESFEGCGVRLVDVADVRIEGLVVRGFRAGVRATRCPRLALTRCDVSDNRAQRLRSTPSRCDDGADWLAPHDNDADEWYDRYGAGVYIEDSAGVRLSEIACRRTQNGIVLDRVDGATVVDCDCSFLSGWGLALWRANDNLIARNAFDFCIRGYSHGVYNRGQDSAGILLFEQCSRNRFYENSVTHGGDGLFGFAGREALGERGAEGRPDAHYRRRGCNDNVFFRNDFSFAAAHGLELTFSFGTLVLDNLFEGNAICGVWAGYGQESRIEGNEFRDNGGAGYGLERGGVNIDSGAGNRIVGNVFVGDRCGVHLWGRDGGGFRDRPWGRANPPAAPEVVLDNVFRGVSPALHLRGTKPVVWRAAPHPEDEPPPALRWEDGAANAPDAAVDEAARVSPASRPAPDAIPGRTRPRQGRARLRGRDRIVMTPYGPWDHATPLVRPVETAGRRHLYRLLATGRPEAIVDAATGRPLDVAAPIEAEFGKADRDGGYPLVVRAKAPGIAPYALRVLVPGLAPLAVEGVLTDARFDAVFFPSPTDPRRDEAAWRAGAEAPGAVRAELAGLDLPFGSGGPSEVRGIPPAVAAAKLPPDRFGVLATALVPFPAGRFLLRVRSDDGVRLAVDGKVVIDDWTWHVPRDAESVLVLDAPRAVRLDVAYFELDGHATLGLEILPAP